MTNQLPSYIASASPNPQDKRAPWYANTAPTYAGIFLWFVFWQDAVKTGSLGGGLSQGIGVALGSLVVSALICHFLFYLIPATLGMRSGLPLYIVGTSTFGATGGFLMPGFLMGLLQFGWLGVNIYFSSIALNAMFNLSSATPIMIVWGVLAAFMGLKGIQYVGKVASILPIIPFVVLIVLFVKTVGGLGSFDQNKLIEMHKAVTPDAGAALSGFGVFALMVTYVVGFFATAGAAGVDFGSGMRNKSDVSMGGLVGVALAIVFTAGISLLVVAGVYGSADLSKEALGIAGEKKSFILDSFSLIPAILGKDTAKIVMFLLALTAFPSACFSSLIAANCFKTTLPKVNPFVSVGIGAAVSIGLAVSGKAGEVAPVFGIIGASFGPVCGAMMVDYVLAGNRWAGPRVGINPAGWLAWALGFIVGILPNGMLPASIRVDIPCAPVAAFIVGAIVYFVCAKIGLESKVIPMTGALAESTK